MDNANVMTKLQQAEKPSSFEVATFDKGKAGQDGIGFESCVIMQQVKENTDSKFMKKASLSFNLPGWSAWQVYIDEGTTGGGTDAAPSPLGFLSIGVASCLLTHLTGNIKMMGLNIQSIKIEQRIQFHTTYNFANMHPKDNHGSTRSLLTNILVESPEPAEKLQELVAYSEQACFAMHAFINQVQSSTQLIVNNEVVEPAAE